MSALILATEPAAIQVSITDEKLIVKLADGRGISIPLAWHPRLLHGSLQIGNCSATVTLSSGLTSTSASVSKSLSPEDAVAKVKSRLNGGWPRGC